MSLKMRLGIPAAFLISGLTLQASASSSPTFEVGTWANFCQGAISHTFDDYAMNSPPKVVLGSIVNGQGRAAFDAKGFHATIFTVTNTCNAANWTALQDAFAHGFEVGSHSVTHAADANQLGPSQDTIRKHVPGEMCVSFAYPNGTAVSGVLNRYIAARNISGSVNAKSPSNFAQINTQGFGVPNYSNDANSMNSLADKAISGNQWATAMHHGIGEDKHDWAATSLDAMKTHLDYLDKNRAKIWCETFGNVARYIRERDAAKVTVKSSDANSITVQITDGLADSIFNYPLTLRTTLPSGWTTAAVKQETKAVWDTIVTASSKQYIMFHAVPDGGDIVLSKDATGIADRSLRAVWSIGNPITRHRGSIIIDAQKFGNAHFNVTIFNVQGKLLAHYRHSFQGSNAVIPINTFKNETFFVKIAGVNPTYTEKFIPQF